MVNLFDKQGALDEKELREFIELYEKYGGEDFESEINLGDNVSEGIQRLVNKSAHDMSRLSDRLALTIIELSKRKLKQHTGDCTRYASLINGNPESGICTCGYGLEVMRETGDNNELYSQELRERLTCAGGGITI